MDRKLVSLFSGLAFVIVSGGAEYALSGGTSGWIPLAAGAAGAVAGWLVPFVSRSGAKSGDDPAAPVVKRTASELMALVSPGLTAVEASNLVKPHIGSIIEVSGVVTDVSEVSESTLRFARSVGVFFRIEDGRLIGAWLHRSCADEGRRLRLGDRVSVSGKVSEIGRDRLWMESCRLKPLDDADPS